ncbi:MAG TPA: MMPL family transporter [Mycobacteriales bacterium]
MFEALGRGVFRRRWAVIAAAAAFLVFAGVWGTGVFGKLTGSGFDDPGSESYRAAQIATEKLGRDEADVIVVYRSGTRTVEDASFRQAVTSTLGALPRDVVVGTTTFWSSGAPQLVSSDRHSTYAVLQLAGDEEQRRDGLEGIEDGLAAPGLATMVGGGDVLSRDINERVSEDIAGAETLSMPVLLVLLVLIFGSVAAAGLPLAIGVTSILGAFTALRGLTTVTDVSVFSINVITILGMGLAIDYGLFVVSRFREELRRGLGTEEAVARTMATAGRTVAVSGLTVAVALAGLMIFPQVFLRSMGFGGMAAVGIAMIAALTLLPALLSVLGHRVDALAIRPLLRRRAAADPDRGAWARLAASVMRRPVLYAVGVVAILVALGLPFLRVTFGGIDARALPAGTESRVVAETIDRDFTTNAASPIEAVLALPAPVGTPVGQAALNGWTSAARSLPGITSVRVTGTAEDTARVSLGYRADPMSAEARDLVGQVRALPMPDGGSALVGGRTAELSDLLSSIGSRLPWMALIVVGSSFVLLFLAFGSVLLPVKAVLMNVLSLSASFGAIVWIFQDGNLSGVLGFTPTGTLEATQPILVLALVFGLSMDYEVFLMSRIREQYDLTGDNTRAVATGLQRTGGIITSAALLLIVVIGAFSLSGITFIKLIGLAMIIAILVDATVVRALLVPATMRLLGRANWWAPAPLARFYARYGLKEADTPAIPAERTPVPV